ncbi:MAG: hypothetical protein ACFFB0_09565 [Promethearchaeota archaeon]
MKIIDVLRSKIVIFIIQIIIFSMLIYIFNYRYVLNLQLYPPTPDTTEDQIKVIEFLGTYLMYEDLNDAIFIYLCWSLISIIPVLIYYDYVKAFKMNFATFLIFNFFFYVFLYRHLNYYFKENFIIIFTKTYLTAILITVLSIETSLILNKFRKHKIEEELEDLQIIVRRIITKCPKCGAEFNSVPQFCYNCNTRIIKDREKNGGIE